MGDAETTSRVSMLQTPPTFGKRLDRNQDVNEGERLELKAKVNGSPKPTVSILYTEKFSQEYDKLLYSQVTWYKDGEPISPNDDNIKTAFLPDGTVKLTIENCKPSDSGAYKLVIKNPNGESACLCAVAVTRKYSQNSYYL